MAPWPSYGYIKSGVRPEVPERHGPEESYPWLFWKTSKSATAFVRIGDSSIYRFSIVALNTAAVLLNPRLTHGLIWRLGFINKNTLVL